MQDIFIYPFFLKNKLVMSSLQVHLSEVLKHAVIISQREQLHFNEGSQNIDQWREVISERKGPQ